VECGVFRGNGLGAFLHLSSAYDPFDFTRRIVGFDSFDGMKSFHKSDRSYNLGDFSDTDFSFTQDLLGLHVENTAVPKMPESESPRVELVRGDALKALPSYVETHPELIVSLLYLDFDLYEPTKIALEQLEPLVPLGGVIAFDELNQARGAGETLAFKQVLGIKNVKLRKFFFDPHVSYYVKE